MRLPNNRWPKFNQIMTNLSIKLCQEATVTGPLILTAAAPVEKVLAVALSKCRDALASVGTSFLPAR